MFAKTPQPGRVKTRLASRLGETAAVRLYEAFLADTVAQCRAAEEAHVELWAALETRSPNEADSAEYFQRHFPDLPLRRQIGDHLGDRLRGAFAVAFDEGADYVVVTGSDHPTLPARYLSRAFKALIAAHLVIGPSEDGGYYLIGLRRYAWPAAAGLFEGVPWSTPDVLTVTRSHARRLGLCHVELPEWYDIDDPSDLQRLRRDLDARSHTARALDLWAAEGSAGQDGVCFDDLPE